MGVEEWIQNNARILALVLMAPSVAFLWGVETVMDYELKSIYGLAGMAGSAVLIWIYTLEKTRLEETIEKEEGFSDLKKDIPHDEIRRERYGG